MVTCPTCTLDNSSNLLCCEACGSELPRSGVACPRCTFANAEDASACVACGMPLEQVLPPWSCPTCISTADATTTVDLNCLHVGCQPCLLAWIEACDAESREPTCISCDGEGTRRVLTDDEVHAIMGDVAHARRAERLAEQCVRLFYCAHCQHPFELDCDVAKRFTTCPGCKKEVVLREEALDVTHAAAQAVASPDAVAQGSPAQSSAAQELPAQGPAAQGSSSAAVRNEVICLNDSDEEEAMTLRERSRKRRREQPVATEVAASEAAASEVAASEALRAALDATTQRCPKCSRLVSKNSAEECDKMICVPSCGCHFCFHCGKEYKLSGAARRAPCRCNIERYGRGHSFPRPPTP